MLCNYLLSIYAYTDRPGLLWTLARESAFCSWQQSTQGPITGQNTENKSLRTSLSHPTPTPEFRSQRIRMGSAVKCHLLAMAWLVPMHTYVGSSWPEFYHRWGWYSPDPTPKPRLSRQLVATGEGKMILLWEYGHYLVSHASINAPPPSITYDLLPLDMVDH